MRLPLPFRLLTLALLPLLAGCENSATAYSIQGNQHSIVLIREQGRFWDSTVSQAIVVSRMPECQRRVAIHPGTTEFAEMSVYAAGDLLWALRQGNRWYLASTGRCLVQDWGGPDGGEPGPLIGSFRLRDGAPSFVAAEAAN